MTKQFTLRPIAQGSAIGLCALFFGCSSNPTADVPAEPASPLGIVEFQVEDRADKTTVVGVDAAGEEVGRLELIHGRFGLTPMFQDDYPGQAVVDGRKMDVTIFGEKRFTYETAGYGPVMNMPPHPPGEEDLNAFLEDPHVKPILDNWGIGFQPFTARVTEVAGVGESSLALRFDSGSDSGYHFADCSSPAVDCGTPRPNTAPTVKANTCGGGTPAFVAGRVTRTVYDEPEWMIAQCCPAGSGGQFHDWFGRKSCPLDDTSPFSYNNTCDPHATANYSTGACKACPGYPAVAANSCDVTYDEIHGQMNWSFD